MPLPFARIVRFPGPFSQVWMRDGMSKSYAPFSSGWSLNSQNCLPFICNDHSIRIIWLNGKHPKTPIHFSGGGVDLFGNLIDGRQNAVWWWDSAEL